MQAGRRSCGGWWQRALGACTVLFISAVAPAGVEPVDVLLIPNSGANTIMAFSTADGSLLNAQFIPDPGSMDGVTFSRPLHAIASSWGTILVADQLRHMVAEFDYDGNYIRIFAPAGGPDQQVLRNVRGLSLHANGDVLVSNVGPSSGIAATSHAVARFQGDSMKVDPFIFQRYGGIAGPFDVLVLSEMILVSAEGTNFVARYTLEGKFDELFARDLSFPQQLAEAANGNILLAVFSGGYIAEFERDGTPVGQYSVGLSGFRGVAELDNGNLLVTSSTGVHEINRQGQLVSTKFASSEMRYIERVTLPALAVSGDRLRSSDDCVNHTDGEEPAGSLDADSERGEP